MPSDNESSARDRFPTTVWSIVAAAGEDGGERSRKALEELCHKYWQPLHAYVIRRGVPDDQAQDLTQSFFAKLLEKNYVRDASREQGRFRTFLLASLRHFLANEFDAQRAQKRGGEYRQVSLQSVDETKGGVTGSTSPERDYEKHWALTVMSNARQCLQDEMARSDRLRLFETLSGVLDGDGDVSYRKLAAAAGMSEGAIKVAVHRLRRRYREMVQREVANTVADPEQADQELQFLRRALES
jgi:RNA polymerase sigma factor (sigma-70 family)